MRIASGNHVKHCDPSGARRFRGTCIAIGPMAHPQAERSDRVSQPVRDAIARELQAILCPGAQRSGRSPRGSRAVQR